jgi:hypothetical protein
MFCTLHADFLHRNHSIGIVFLHNRRCVDLKGPCAVNLGPRKGGVFLDVNGGTKKLGRARGLTSTKFAQTFDKRIQLMYQNSPCRLCNCNDRGRIATALYRKEE